MPSRYTDKPKLLNRHRHSKTKYSMPGKKKKYNARFPPARIKKIMQSDEEVGKVAAAVPVIISRALELFVENMLKKANEVTSRRGARTLTPSHLKFCINSESRFDFLKDLVSAVPDLQGDMDINLDAIPTGSIGSEPMSPQVITSVPSTTSSISWPSEYSAAPSHMLPSNSSAIETSSPYSQSVEASVSMVSQQYSKSGLKNNLNRNNNTSRNAGSYPKDETLQNTRNDDNVTESKESMNTKGMRKRGRPRKSSTDASASNKPKKPKTSPNDTNSHPVQENLPPVNATQYSLSYRPPSETTLTDLDDKLINKIETAKTNNLASLVKSNSLTDNSAPDKHQFLRTYSTGSTASPNMSTLSSSNTSIPSFTLTYPMIPSNTGHEIKSKKSKSTNKSSSSQIEIQRPKLKNNSTGELSDHQGEKINHDPISNNGFPFTITNILEKQLTSNKQTVALEKPVKENDESAGLINNQHSLQQETKCNFKQSLNCNTIQNTENPSNFNSATEKAKATTISWTMDVIAPKIKVSEEIDEDYDA